MSNLKMLEVLLRYGANPNIVDKVINIHEFFSFLSKINLLYFIVLKTTLLKE